MPLRLITGAANSGKTGEVLSEILAAAAGGTSPVLVVPTLADARRLEDELARKRSLGVRVSTLKQFVRDLWLLHGDGRRMVGSHARHSIIAGVLSQGVDASLRPIAQTPGLPRLISRLAAQGGLDLLEKHGGGARAALGELLARYQLALEEAGLVEEETVSQILATTNAKLSGPLGVVRFDTLAAGEIALLVGLAEGNPVTVALTWEPGFCPTRANDAIVTLVCALTSEHVRLSEPEAAGEIAELARALFRGPSGLLSRGDVVTEVALGAEAEIAAVAHFVAQAIAEGTAPERVAVVFPDVSRRLTELRAAFRSAEIPAEFQVGVRFSATPFGRAYRSLLVLVTGPGGREEALTFSASPFSGAAPGAAQDLDRRWRTSQQVQPGVLARSLRELGEATKTAVDAALAAGRTPLTQDSLPKWQELADALLRASVEGMRRSTAESRSEDAAAYQAISAALSEMAQVPTSFLPADVVRALGDIVVRADSREATGKVQVCDLDAVGARRFDIVVMAGLTDNEISTADRESVELEWEPVTGPTCEASAGDLVRLKFYSLVTRARSRLVLIRQEGNSEGAQYRPSTVWEDVLEAYRPQGEREGGAEHARPTALASGRRVDALGTALSHGRMRERESAGSLRFKVAARSRVESERGLSALGAERMYSPTEVETYLECPYRWFHERIVRPDDIDPEFDARERGERAHRLLAAFYQYLAAEGPRPRVTVEWVDEALGLFDEIARGELLRMPQPRTLPEELAAARAWTWARGTVEADAGFLPGFIPAYSEITFGEEPPFEFAGVMFRGRIDRVDMGPTSAFLTDYKSSPDVAGVAKFGDSGKVQPVIYAASAQALLGVPVSGSVYRSMRSGKLRGFWRRDLFGQMPKGMRADDGIDEQGYTDLIVRTSERVAAAIDGMKAGRVERKPGVRGACTYCGISAVCEESRR